MCSVPLAVWNIIYRENGIESETGLGVREGNKRLSILLYTDDMILLGVSSEDL